MAKFLGFHLNGGYLNLVEKYREEDKNQLDIVCHRHHIVPRCIGGPDIEENIVKVTREHHIELHGRILNGFKGSQYMDLLYAYHKMKWGETPKEHAHRMKHEKKRKKREERISERMSKIF